MGNALGMALRGLPLRTGKPRDSTVAPSFGQELGSMNLGSGASGSIAITVGAAAAVNTRVCVAIVCSNSVTVTSVTDSRGNTYALDKAIGAGSVRVELWSALVAIALLGSLGHQITVNYSGAATLRVALAFRLDNVKTTSPVDATASATGTSTSPASGATAATAQAGEISIGVVGSGTAATFAPGTGYTNTGSGPVGTSQQVSVEYKQLNATGAQNAGGTLGSSVDWAAVCVTYKGA